MANSIGPVGGPNKKRFEDRERRLKKAMGDEDLLVKKRSDMRPVEEDSGFGKEGGGKSGMDARRKSKPIDKADYEDDFETEAKIIELKDKKKELLKGISGKSEKEKKEVRKKLEELNEKIEDLENK